MTVTTTTIDGDVDDGMRSFRTRIHLAMAHHWHTSVTEPRRAVRRFTASRSIPRDASLVSVDELPVPPQKEKLWLPVPNVVKPHGRSVPN